MSAQRALNPMPMAGLQLQLGRVVEVREGQPWVLIDGQSSQPLRARVAASGVAAGMALGRAVLLALPEIERDGPVIVAWVQDQLPATTPMPGLDVELDGRRVQLQAEEEVVLRCGQASITLRADGQVVIKGTRLTSRASETNKVRGATVLIN
jgi:hypothetical protein